MPTLAEPDPSAYPHPADLAPSYHAAPPVAPEGAAAGRPEKWYDFTHHVPVPNRPGINVAPPASENQPWQQAAFDPDTGQLNPASPGLTKLGKVFSVLTMLAKGAAEGSGNVYFGQGFKAAEEARQKDIANYQAGQKNAVETAIARSNLAFLPTQREFQLSQMALNNEYLRGKTANQFAQANVNESRSNLYDTKAQERTLQQAYSNAVQQAMKEGRDPSADPEVKRYAQSINAIRTQQHQTDIQGYVSDWLDKNGLPNTAANRLKAHAAYTKETKIDPSMARVQAMGDIRGPTVTDTRTNITAPISWNEYNRASKAEPGRYISPQYDPEIIARNSAARALAPGGPIEVQVRSYNTYLRHSANLYKAIDDLQNSGYQDWNHSINWLRQHTGDPRVQTFLAKIEPVQKEFQSFLLNNRALYAEDREAAQSLFNVDTPADTMRSVLQTMIHTGTARLDETNNGFIRATGYNIPDILSPEAADAVDLVGGPEASRELPPNVPRSQSIFAKPTGGGGGGGGGATDFHGANWDASKWAAAHPGKDWRKAAAQARKQNATVINEPK